MSPMPRPTDLSRRALLAGGGALVVSFALTDARAQDAPAQPGQGAPKPPALPGSLKTSPMLDSWIRIDADGRITVLTGKAEIGQGIKTALLQIAADELGVDPGAELRQLYHQILNAEDVQAVIPAARAEPVPGPVPAQLPADIRDFTGRSGSFANC